MYKDLNEAQLRLAEFMSDLSEKSWYAGWMGGLEFALWDIMHGADRYYGRYLLSADDIQMLVKLPKEAGSWIYFDDGREETAIDLVNWLAYYQLHRPSEK